jgi:hypothetical protein
LQHKLVSPHVCRDAAAEASTSGSKEAAGSNAGYLSQKLVYTPEGDKLLDADGRAVCLHTTTAV